MATARRLDSGVAQEASAGLIREFAFTDDDFRNLAKLAYQQTGITLADTKRNLVYGRLSRRLRALGLASFRDYWKFLAEDPTELERFINSISTNLTRFFREVHHFEHLGSEVARPYAEASRKGRGGRLRIWSAGCSTGEEPYSIAAVLVREIAGAERQDVRILATDIDTDVLSKCRQAVYPESSLDDIPPTFRSAFEKNREAGSAQTISPVASARSLTVFKQLNLLHSWPIKGHFDAIFCRNVMIYFDGPTKTALVERFMQQLRPNGFLYIGHSESLIGNVQGLSLIGRTTYRRGN
jgi:chemotaxis protein methyltransferase CheR